MQERVSIYKDSIMVESNRYYNPTHEGEKDRENKLMKDYVDSIFDMIIGDREYTDSYVIINGDNNNELKTVMGPVFEDVNYKTNYLDERFMTRYVRAIKFI